MIFNHFLIRIHVYASIGDSSLSFHFCMNLGTTFACAFVPLYLNFGVVLIKFVSLYYYKMMIITCSSRGSDSYHRFVACNICLSPIGLLISWHYRRVIKTHISFTRVSQPVKNEHVSKLKNTKQVGRVEELGAINQNLFLSHCIYFRHKSCRFSIFCIYFVFIICLN